MVQETPHRRLSDREPLHRRVTDQEAMPLYFQSRLHVLKLAMQGLCVLIMVLQAFDAISTFMGLNTGHLSEKNILLLTTAHLLNAPIESVVLGAKALVAALFGWLMFNSKPTLNGVVMLFFVAVFYIIVVQRNIYWFSIAQAVQSLN